MAGTSDYEIYEVSRKSNASAPVIDAYPGIQVLSLKVRHFKNIFTAIKIETLLKNKTVPIIDIVMICVFNFIYQLLEQHCTPTIPLAARHTYATLLARTGVDTNAIKQRY